MDIDALLQSSSLRDQSTAAVFLQSPRSPGAQHLPVLFQRCQAIDANKVLDRYEERLLGCGAMSMGTILGRIGFDSQDTLHFAILQWISQLTSSTNRSVAAGAIYGLGSLGVCHPLAIESLCGLVRDDARVDEETNISLRAIALRNLRRLDSGIAAQFVATCAFQEYALAIEQWIATGAAISSESQSELLEERAWLIATKRSE
jgi:hypothetical protein